MLFYGLIYEKRALLFAFTAPLFALAVPAIYAAFRLRLEKRFYWWKRGCQCQCAGLARNNVGQRAELYSTKAGIWFWVGLLTFYSVEFFPLDRLGHPAHNMYIQFVFETGIVGLVCFLWIFAQCFLWLGVRWHIDRRGVAISFALLFTYAVVCYSDNIFDYLSFNWCFWFLSGLCFARLVRVRGAFRSRRHRRARIEIGNVTYAGQTRRSLAS